jgi:hypothetical protein
MLIHLKKNLSIIEGKKEEFASRSRRTLPRLRTQPKVAVELHAAEVAVLRSEKPPAMDQVDIYDNIRMILDLDIL